MNYNDLFSSEKDSTPCFVGAIKIRNYNERMNDLKKIFEKYKNGSRYQLIREINEYFKEME